MIMGASDSRRPVAQLFATAMLITGIWITFAFFNASEFYRRSIASGGDSRWNEIILFQLSSSLIWAFFTPIIYAIAERLPVQNRQWARNLALLTLLAPALALLRAVFGGAWGQLAEGNSPTWQFAQLSIAVRFHRNVFLTIVVIGLTNIILAYRRSVMREQDTFALQSALTNASLAQLRARMLPRVMFATLRNIAQRVDRDPNGADDLIVSLSDLLRSTLALDRRSDITIAEELEHIDRYLDLERARAGGRLVTRIDFDEPLLAARVPPLVLHTLVEHALDGGDGDRTLEIKGREIDGMLNIRIEKEGNSADDAPPPRLEQLLTHQFSLGRRREGSKDIVAIELPLRMVEVAS
jgi:two-component system LytT family sensor kinase